MDDVTCSVDGCRLPSHAFGLCSAHAGRLRRHGDVQAHIPIGARPKPSTGERIVALTRWSTDRSYGGTPCLEWTGAKNDRGYARIKIARVRVMVHRWMYEAMFGPIRARHVIDHLCRNPSCCNPLHLEPVTQSTNVLRGVGPDRERSKTHCPQGHPYDEENTAIVRGKRRCKQCHRERASRRYHARRPRMS